VESSDLNLQKAKLRKLLLQQRQALSVEVWQRNSDRLCTHLRNAESFRQAITILSFFSHRQEADLSSLSTLERRWGFPRCQGQNLVWHLWQPGQTHDLQTGAYGILEPKPHLPVLTADEVDLILVPAVACDVRGYRLGYGGGFYDRLLSQPQWRSLPTIGIVFEFALLPQLPIQNWDQPLQAVCTEVGLINIFRNHRLLD
jgi:5-formyltetrahydrofolate cyclo-ligase